MNPPLDEAGLAVQKARQALRNGDRTQARQWAERAAQLAPQLEDPWLILAAVASPRASVEFIRTALKINPDSPRARQGMEWAMQRLRSGPPATSQAKSGEHSEPGPAVPAGLPRLTTVPAAASAAEPAGKQRPAQRNVLAAVLVFGTGCLLCVAAVWSAARSPAFTAILHQAAAVPSHPQVWAHVDIPKPTYTAAALAQMPATLTPASIASGTLPATLEAAVLPSETPLPAFPSETAAPPPVTPTWSGSLSVSIVPDTATVESPTNAPLPSSGPGSPVAGGARWIDVNLTQQMVYAYQGDSVVNSFLVSTGTWQYPTVTGQYHVYVKLRYTDMSGPGYYLPNVPYTMYFYEGYGLHGTYWHHNFGTPMSHGCVNLSTPDAAWLYDWASVGTLVNIHY